MICLFIDFFYFFPRLREKRESKKSMKQTKNTPNNARTENEPLVLAKRLSIKIFFNVQMI